jgi:ABC-type transport system involved in cytochrome bd biosynthesis fused ATPase/permease subunit
VITPKEDEMIDQLRLAWAGILGALSILNWPLFLGLTVATLVFGLAIRLVVRLIARRRRARLEQAVANYFQNEYVFELPGDGR